MELKHYLTAKKTPILHRWIQNIRKTYPHELAEWSSRIGHEFANPVGHVIVKETEAIFEGLLRGVDPAGLSGSLDRILRIRAVQDFSPAQAASILFHLKEAIRKELKDEIGDNKTSLELLAFESRIDELALLSFNIYMKCREDIHELKLKEAKAAGSRALDLLQRASVLSGDSRPFDGSDEGDVEE
jgi:hypothetical protein